MRERDREPVRGGDRDHATGTRDAAREGHGARNRSTHGVARLRTDVDASVLPGRVRVRRVEAERLEDGTTDGPRPGTRHRRDEQRGHNR
ncbi:MAG TPA: hypothetical protein VFJ93_11410, partial [Gaiellaceae bacterium]|nr:hypothetical protein [Gaiellaceae bacterium]